ncbi:MAG: protein-L-isoaspartate(D-aspartate) O-methyltransferase [Armatimonadetes bacterium]|nr:protein-L-isoaspartate(D-aspartate) O-methyltransferase [Armatimonadota bacterium]
MVRSQIEKRGIAHPLVLEAMRAVPRHRFLPDRLRDQAYDDQALPIGEGQTISQPYIVACMLAALQPTGRGRALDVGVGSGYQSALLSRLFDEVIGVERVAPLAARAARTLQDLGCSNTTVVVADGTLGYPQAAPYDAIVVGAGAPAVPEPLVEQLASGGRLVIPVGDRYLQRIVTVTKGAEGAVTEEGIGCVFVPLLGEHGW